jgi:hypothetical protein
VLDFLEHMRYQLRSQISFGQLLLQASERQSNHVGGSDGNPFKLSLRSNSAAASCGVVELRAFVVNLSDDAWAGR